jgi:hypothetical protein
MSERQHTIFGDSVPTTYHRDDMIQCANGVECRYADCMQAVNGESFGGKYAADDRTDHEVDLVREVLKGIDTSDDHGGEYCYLALENPAEATTRIRDWLDQEQGIYLEPYMCPHCAGNW